MNKLLRAAFFAFIPLLITACASGPKMSEVQSSIPAIKTGEGRIYFYRQGSMFGAAIQPNISLNGTVVGESKPGGFFFVDQPPGDKEVRVATEVEKILNFKLEAGQTQYVRTSISMGVLVGRVTPELMHEETAKNDLAETSYTGTALLTGNTGQPQATRTTNAPAPATSTTTPAAAPVASQQPATPTSDTAKNSVAQAPQEWRYDYKDRYGKRGEITVSPRSRTENLVIDDYYFANKPVGSIRWAQNSPAIVPLTGGGAEWVEISPFVTSAIGQGIRNLPPVVLGGENFNTTLRTFPQQTITTPAGSFNVTKLEIRGKKSVGAAIGSTQSIYAMYSFSIDAWYSAELGRLVKLNYKSASADVGKVMDQYEMNLLK